MMRGGFVIGISSICFLVKRDDDIKLEKRGL